MGVRVEERARLLIPHRAVITVTAHTYADLYDSDLDRMADALDGLGG